MTSRVVDRKDPFNATLAISSLWSSNLLSKQRDESGRRVTCQYINSFPQCCELLWNGEIKLPRSRTVSDDVPNVYKRTTNSNGIWIFLIIPDKWYYQGLFEFVIDVKWHGWTPLKYSISTKFCAAAMCVFVCVSLYVCMNSNTLL